MSIVLDGTTGITTPTTDSTAEHVTSVTSMKNRIINGGMVIDQRNAGATLTSAGDGTWVVDRWICYHNIATVNLGQALNSITPPAGFNAYLGIQVTTPATATSGQYTNFQHYVEGFNVADLAWGTASAQPITISFWVRSSITGTQGFAIQNASSALGYPFTVTINAANTWEYKTVTIAGSTTGTWNTTNGRGIALIVDLGMGSSFRFTAGSWQAGNVQGVTGANSLNQTSGATFYITGVQLEKGSVATSFDYRPYSTELSLCQRYYSTSFPYGTAPVQNSGLYTWKVTILTSGYGTFSQIQYPVPMRITGTTITGYNGGAANTLVRNIPAAVDITNLSISATSTTGFGIQYYGGAGDGGGAPVGWNWSASAEL